MFSVWDALGIDTKVDVPDPCRRWGRMCLKRALISIRPPGCQDGAMHRVLCRAGVGVGVTEKEQLPQQPDWK